MFKKQNKDSSSSKVSMTLARILGDEFSCENSLDNISTTFHHQITEADYFQVGQTIEFMLRNPDMLSTKHQKATALFLVYEMFKSEPLYLNPFADIFVEALEVHSSMSLRIFCSHLANVHTDQGITNASSVLHEMLRKTPKLLVHEFESLSSQSILDVKAFLTGMGR